MSILKEQVEKAKTELAKRWARILYLEDVVSSQNGVNMRQASEILGNRAEIEGLQRQLAESERLRVQALEALRRIREAGNNFTEWAIWAQRTAAWGMQPSKWPEQNKDAPE